MTLFDKKSIRSQVLKLRDSLSKEERVLNDRTILYSILKLSIVQQAKVIHSYCSFASEVSTVELIQQFLLMQKNVVVPIIQNNNKTLLHSTIDSFTTFVPGHFGIPIPNIVNLIPREELNHQKTIIIVPLVGFDKQCNRIGYGGGYYDRFLQHIPLSIKIGIAFSCQEIDSIPLDTTDIPLDFIVTEQKIFSQY